MDIKFTMGLALQILVSHLPLALHTSDLHLPNNGPR